MVYKLNNNIYIVIIFFLFFLCIFLRSYKITQIPPSLSWDEVAIGYNAYSILKTGKDEYGSFMPTLFRSFDDYKLPGLIYTSVLPIALFGLNEFAVRLPSMLAGIGIVVLGFFLGKEIINKKFGLLFSALLAINPWLINFSRQAFESNLGTFFVFLGIFFLLKSLKKFKYFYLANLFFALSLYYYYSPRFVIPFILIAYFFVNYEMIKKHAKHAFLGFFVFVVLLIPLIRATITPGAMLKVDQVLITSDKVYTEKAQRFSEIIAEHNNALFYRIFFNRRVAFVYAVTENYVKNLSFEHLFKTGLSQSGLMHLWELPFLIVGIIFVLRYPKKWKWLFIAYLVSYPLAGAITKEQPNALRTLIGAPVLDLFIAFGLYAVYRVLKKYQGLRQLATAAFIGIYIVSAINVYISYFNNGSILRSTDFGDGYKQLAEFLRKEDTYKKIWITGDRWRPYIHILFHQKVDPLEYQKSGTPDSFGYYSFGNASWDTEGTYLGSADLQELNAPATLFILSDSEYIKQKSKHTFKTEIPVNGLYTDHVFWAVTL
jgi:4-amino-4-deoxy-L-arabinose transferase-like glycosyltransferase